MERGKPALGCPMVRAHTSTSAKYKFKCINKSVDAKILLKQHFFPNETSLKQTKLAIFCSLLMYS
jgi:hypothetical protein